MYVKRLVIAFILLVLAFSAMAEKVYTVSGKSMSPTLEHGDRVYVEHIDKEYKFKHRDLVAIKIGRRDNPMVKRVAAVEGDIVKFIDGKLLVNNTEIRTINTDEWKVTMRQIENYGGSIPKNSLLVLGDNPENSRDSKRFGLIARDQVIGVVTKIMVRDYMPVR